MQTQLKVQEADYLAVMSDFHTVKSGALKALEFYKKQYIVSLEDHDKIESLYKEISLKEQRIQDMLMEIERGHKEMQERDQQLEVFMTQIEEQ